MRRWEVLVALCLVVVLVCLPGPRAYADAVSAVGVLGLWFGGGLGGLAYVAGAVLAVAIGIAIGAEVHPLSRFVEWVNRSTVVDDYISTLDVSQQADLAVMGQQYVSTGSMTVPASIASTVSYFEPVAHAYPIGDMLVPDVGWPDQYDYDLGDAVMFTPQTVSELVAESILYMTGAHRTYYLAPFFYNYGDWSVDVGEIWTLSAGTMILVWWEVTQDYFRPVFGLEMPAVEIRYDIQDVYNELGIEIDSSGGAPRPDPNHDWFDWLPWVIGTITVSSAMLKGDPEIMQEAERELIRQAADVLVDEWNWGWDHYDEWNPVGEIPLHPAEFGPVVHYPKVAITPSIDVGAEVSVEGLEIEDLGDGQYSVSVPWLWDGTSEVGVGVEVEELPEEPPGPEGTILEQILDTIQSLPQAIGEAVIGPVTEIDTTVITGPMSDLTLRFPFSLPWDLVRFTELFNVESSDWAPSIALPWGTVSLALPAEFDKLRLLARWGIGVCWDVGLCWACISFFGAGDR